MLVSRIRYLVPGICIRMIRSKSNMKLIVKNEAGRSCTRQDLEVQWIHSNSRHHHHHHHHHLWKQSEGSEAELEVITQWPGSGQYGRPRRIMTPSQFRNTTLVVGEAITSDFSYLPVSRGLLIFADKIAGALYAEYGSTAKQGLGCCGETTCPADPAMQVGTHGPRGSKLRCLCISSALQWVVPICWSHVWRF